MAKLHVYNYACVLRSLPASKAIPYAAHYKKVTLKRICATDLYRHKNTKKKLTKNGM